MDPIKEISGTVLTLDNCIVPRERLLNTPSRQDGMSHELEVDLRLVGCDCIQTAGLLLKLPQVAMATAQVLFQRFYYAKSFVKYSLQPMAMACIFLAAKIEEDCRRIRDVINVFHHLRQKMLGKPVVAMEYMGEEYFKMKATVIKFERFLLKELGFCVHVKHPHKLIITYLTMLEMEKNVSLAQQSWNYMNDSLRTNVFVRFTPEAIACACIYLAARELKIPLPQSPPWWLLFDADYEDIEAISLELLSLYRRPRVMLQRVERRANKLKEELQKKQVDIKEVKLKRSDPSETEPSKKGLLPHTGLLPTPDSVSAFSHSKQSRQGPPPPLSKPKPSPTGSRTPPRSRPIPKSYKVPSPPPPSTTTVTNDSLSATLHVPVPPHARSSRSVSPLATHSLSTHDSSQDKNAPSPIHWPGSPSSRGSDSESRTPSPMHRGGNTPRAYRPVISPIMLSEGSDSARSPSPLSLVRRENGVQEKQRDRSNDKKVRKARHRHGDRRERRERKKVRSRSNEQEDRKRKHRGRESREGDRERERGWREGREERDDYMYEKRWRERERERDRGFDQRPQRPDRYRK